MSNSSNMSYIDRVGGMILRHTPLLRRRSSYYINRYVCGVAFTIPIINGHGFRHFDRFEKETFSILKALMAQRTGTVIDVGANIGQTLLKIKSIDPQIDYLGFEPSPACIYYLDVLIRKNRLTNCVVVPLGASDKPSIISFYYNHDSDAAATTIEGFWTGRLAKSNRRVILVDSGDNVIKRLAVQSVGVIKIDVEGGELEAISGFSDVIRAQATPIVVEILPASCDRDATNPDAEAGISLRIQRLNQLDTLLRELQLTPYRLMPDGQLLETHDFDSDHWDPEMSNYLLVPPSSTLDLDRLSAEFKSEMRRLANL